MIITIILFGISNVYATESNDDVLVKKIKTILESDKPNYKESLKLSGTIKDEKKRNKYTNNVYEEWSEDLIKKGTGNDNKMFNKIWNSPSPCDKSTGSFTFYDSEKKVDGTLGFPIYQISIDQPNIIKDLSIPGGFEKLDETHVKNAYGGMIYEQIFEGKKMTHKHGEHLVIFYECTQDDLDVDKIIETIRELKWKNETSLKNIKF